MHSAQEPVNSFLCTREIVTVCMRASSGYIILKFEGGRIVIKSLYMIGVHFSILYAEIQVKTLSYDC